MLVVFFCVMMKMLELSSAHVTASLANEDRRKLRQRRQRVPRRRRGAAAAARASQSPATGTGASVVASGTGAMDDGGGGGGGRAASPALLLGSSPGAAHAHAHALALALERDCNSNAAGSFASESASLPDADFVQECQDYQWFLDYGYREGGGPQPGAGLLASLASSSGLTAPAGYEDLARDIDANLAEVDMEDFRSEDIHSVLSTLPAMCCGDLQAACEPGGEMFASVSGSLLARLEMDASSAGSPPSCGSQADDSAGSTDTMSLCKSELLFSPVKDCPLPGSNFSVDSLDCDLLTEHDIMLTCQANKDNYTIAFEGSVTLYSEDSDYHEPDLDAGGAGAAGGGGAGGPAQGPGGGGGGGVAAQRQVEQLRQEVTRLKCDKLDLLRQNVTCQRDIKRLREKELQLQSDLAAASKEILRLRDLLKDYGSPTGSGEGSPV